jgi:hypothetical protein
MKPLTDTQRNFLLKLAALCRENHAGFGYTTADDGVHIEMDNELIFTGFLFDGAAETIEAEVAKRKVSIIDRVEDLVTVFVLSRKYHHIPPTTVWLGPKEQKEYQIEIIERGGIIGGEPLRLTDGTCRFYHPMCPEHLTVRFMTADGIQVGINEREQ